MNIKTHAEDMGDDDASLWLVTATCGDITRTVTNRDRHAAIEQAVALAKADYFLELEHDDAEMRRDIAFYVNQGMVLSGPAGELQF